MLEVGKKQPERKNLAVFFQFEDCASQHKIKIRIFSSYSYLWKSHNTGQVGITQDIT